MPPAADEASANLPSAQALMKPGADSEGTSTTSPFMVPNSPLVTFHLPVDWPPMSGALSSTNLKVVPGAPSKVTSGTVESEVAAA